MTSIARQAAARRKSVRIGLVSLFAAVAVTAFALTAQNGVPNYVPGVDRTELAAQFVDAGALRTGDEVRIADLRAGYVESIELVDGEPVVTMQLDGGRPVYADAAASIAARSSLGQKYVLLDPGTREAGELTETIPVERTRSAVELDQVLGTFDPKTRRQATRTLRQAGGGLAGRSQDLSDGLNALDEVVGDLGPVSKALNADNGDSLAELLATADQLASRLSGQEQEIAGMTANLATTLDAIGTDSGAPLGQTIGQAPSALRDLRGALKSLNGPLADTEQAAVALRPGAEALEAALPATRGFLREAVPPLQNVPGVAELAEPAVADLATTLGDARPVAKQLRTLARSTADPLRVLAPYASEIALFFEHAASALSQGDSNGRWLRFYTPVNPETITGNAPVDSPVAQRDPYPAPGEAAQHRTNDTQVIP